MREPPARPSPFLDIRPLAVLFALSNDLGVEAEIPVMEVLAQSLLHFRALPVFAALDRYRFLVLEVMAPVFSMKPLTFSLLFGFMTGSPACFHRRLSQQLGADNPLKGGLFLFAPS